MYTLHVWIWCNWQFITHGSAIICSRNRFLYTKQVTVNARIGFSISVFVYLVLCFAASPIRQKPTVPITSLLKQVRNCMHSVTILARYTEYDPWPLRMIPVTSELCGVDDNCVGGVFQKGSPPQGIPSPDDHDEQCNSTNRKLKQLVYSYVKWSLKLSDLNGNWNGWTIFL
jgi:hypothetical protein